jgi:hypothetical protein
MDQLEQAIDRSVGHRNKNILKAATGKGFAKLFRNFAP